MTRQPPPLRLFLLSLALLATVTAVPASAQAPDPRVAQLDAALAANSGNPALQRCLQSDSDVEYFQRAVMAVERSRDPNVPSKFNCSGLGANWQEIPAGETARADRQHRHADGHLSWEDYDDRARDTDTAATRRRRGPVGTGGRGHSQP